MSKSHSLLMLLAAAVLIAASGAAVISAPPAAPAPTETVLLPASSSSDQAPTCGDDSHPATGIGSTENVPGCCSTQCNTDKDCDRICGKGNCACLQQTPCCRRCVY